MSEHEKDILAWTILFLMGFTTIEVMSVGWALNRVTA